MRTSPGSRSVVSRLAAAGLIALLSAGARPASAGVNVSVTPLSQTVTPGAEFEVQLVVSPAGSAFNAFHAEVTYDPAALTLVPLSPLRNQIGTLITGSCSNLFHWFHQGAGVDTIDVGMLCSGVSVTGPGTIYRLHFRASNTPQVTTIGIRPGVEFADGGIQVLDVTAHGAAVGIGMTPVLGADAVAPAPLALAAWPNPARGAVALDFGRPLAAGGALEVHDVAGRIAWRANVAPGSRAATWDGRDASGRAVPPGQYVIVLRAGGVLRTTRVVEIR